MFAKTSCLPVLYLALRLPSGGFNANKKPPVVRRKYK